jgi:hypothetical protein
MKYLIYDCALNGLYTLIRLQQTYPVNVSLFKGTRDEVLFDVAPHIFLVDDKIKEKLGNDEDISLKQILIVESDQPLKVLHDHFKEFIYQKVNKRISYFRFWDPRVLKKFLPSCSDLQLKLFFAPIRRFLLEDEIAGFYLFFERQQNKLNSGKIPVEREQPKPAKAEVMTA